MTQQQKICAVVKALMSNPAAFKACCGHYQ